MKARFQIRIIWMNLWMVLSGTCLYAQPQKIIFNHYGPEEGLTTRTTRSVAKTSDGFLWLTTDDGLVRYDSERFYFFHHNADDPHSIASDACDQMVVDEQDQLWVVTGKGLDKFIPETAHFTHTYIPKDTAAIFAFYPEALAYDGPRKRVWVGTSFGLYYVDNNTDKLSKARVDPSSSTIANATFLAITVDPSGDIWLGNSLGLYKYDPETGSIRKQGPPDKNSECSIADVMHIYVDPERVVWVGTWNSGLIRFDEGTGHCDRFFYADTTQIGNGVNFISSSGFPGQQDILWISAVNFGFGAFNKRTQSFISYHTDLHRDKQGIPGVTNRMLPTESEGMWIASENGLHRYDPSDQVFGNIDLSRHYPLFATAYPVEYLAFERNVTMKDSLCWFHVPYIGAFIYDFYLDQLTKVTASVAQVFQGAVYGMYIDQNNVLWVSNQENGLAGYDIDKASMRFVDQDRQDRPYGRIVQFYEDSQHRLWLATTHGLYVFDREKNAVNEIASVTRLLSEGQWSMFVNGICEDEHGDIWFVNSHERGHKHVLGRYNPSIDKVDLFHTGPSGVHNFPDETELYDIVCGKGKLFVATDHGIMEVQPSSDRVNIHMLAQSEGLINDLNTSLAISNDSLLWCSTVFGVSAYHLQRQYFINYTYTSSGLGNGKLPALYTSPNTGITYIGQQGGVNVIRASQDVYSTALPDVRFTSLRIADEETFPNGSPLINGAQLKFKYNQTPLTVQFAIPGFRHAEANRYAYRLIGLHDAWIYTSLDYVSFANLAPGKYTLQVKGANSAGIWNEPTQLILKIMPPFYMTWWFRVLLLLLVAGIVYTIVRARFMALREQYALRNKIAGDLHDEIGSTLTSIHILSNVSHQAIDSSPAQVKVMLEQISMQSKAIQQNMSDIVWAIRPDNDRIENLVVRIREYTAQTLEPLNIRTGIYIDEQLIHRSLSINERKELLLIAKEAISNIVRHSGATEVNMTLSQKSQKLYLVIQDNGTWKGDAGSTGTGLRSIRHRAGLLGGTAAYSFPGDGTVLTLEWPIT